MSKPRPGAGDSKNVPWGQGDGEGDGLSARSAVAEADVAEASQRVEQALRQICGVIRGKDEVVRLALTGLLARGHILLEDVPGVGKTTLARAIARVIGGRFNRIQLTSDLLPADLLGAPVLDRSTTELRFRPGPIFANVVLADELNRATPRTQSGLLEAMGERSVSVDGSTHLLPNPFFVLATQNPTDHHGVYPLPQSQMDRFLLRMGIGYPDEHTELDLLAGRRVAEVEDIEPVFDPPSLLSAFEAVDQVHLSEDLAGYVQSVVRATRDGRALTTGVSTRGALALVRAARARALVRGRRFVSPSDIRDMAVPVCAHRVVLRGVAHAGHDEASAVFQEILDGVAVPV